MSSGYRNGAFALGLVVGGGLVVNLFLWLDYRARHVVNSNAPKSQNNQDNSETALWWWRWTGDYVSSSDTLAQWIMAVFTIAATVILLWTLRSANKTNLAAIEAAQAAVQANKIMQKQQRPWVLTSDFRLKCERFLTTENDRREGFFVTVVFQNYGLMLTFPRD